MTSCSFFWSLLLFPFSAICPPSICSAFQNFRFGWQSQEMFDNAVTNISILGMLNESAADFTTYFGNSTSERKVYCLFFIQVACGSKDIKPKAA